MANVNLGIDGAIFKLGSQDTNVYLGETKLYPLSYKIWVDDFPSFCDLGLNNDMDNVINNPELYDYGVNIYEYSGDTIQLSGNTYYLWKTENADSKVYYLLTTTVDYNTLYNESMEANFTNTFDSAFIYLNEDQDGTYDFPHDSYQLIKVVDIGNGKLTCYVDDFEADDVQPFIDDPSSMGSNPYNLTTQKIEISGNSYYVWEREMSSGQDNVRYLLTTTNDFNILYNQSMEDNEENDFDSLYTYLKQDGSMYNKSNPSYRKLKLIKIVKI